MNQTIEKWLTIAALTGWVASIGCLVGLAIRATSPAAASRSAQSAPVQVQKTGTSSLNLPRAQSDSVVVNSSKGEWANSSQPRSQPTSHADK